MAAAALLAIFPALMAYAAASDLLTMKIPNRVSIALVGCFPVAAVACGLTPTAIALHAAAGAAVLVVTFGLFALGWVGGGDAKLAAATALWLGLEWAPAYLINSAIWGGVLTLAMLLLRACPLPQAAMARPWVARLHDRRTGIPYGIALAAGGLLVFPHTPVYAALIAR